MGRPFGAGAFCFTLVRCSLTIARIEENRLAPVLLSEALLRVYPYWIWYSPRCCVWTQF
jgi:hypothetical protein